MKKINWIAPVFILIWSTGFIIARYGMPYSEPFTFLFLRSTGVFALMLPVALYLKPQWPNLAQLRHISIAGCLLQFCYIGGVWTAVKHGMPAGLTALIVGLQPILTAFLSSFVSEHVTPRQWLGLGLGITGVALVLFAKLNVEGLSIPSLIFIFGALIAITAGTLYQKRYTPHFDLIAGSVIQFGTTAVLCLPVMFLFETREVQWTTPMIGALLWGIIPISLGAMSLLFILIRRGDATKVSSLMYLTPPTTAFMAWILFGESLTPLVLLGTGVTMIAVLIVNQVSPFKWLKFRVFS